MDGPSPVGTVCMCVCGVRPECIHPVPPLLGARQCVLVVVPGARGRYEFTPHGPPGPEYVVLQKNVERVDIVSMP